MTKADGMSGGRLTNNPRFGRILSSQIRCGGGRATTNMGSSPIADHSARKRVVILGSSGSIGQTAVRLLAGNPLFEVVGLAVNKDTDALFRDAATLGARHVAIADEVSAARAAADMTSGMVLHRGETGICELAAMDADIVLCAVVGMAGLRPVIAAIDAGRDVALATKETLVAAGETVMRRRMEKGVRILPVDSEHSAIFQALQSPCYSPACVRLRGDGSRSAEDAILRLVLTASGGPFMSRPEVDFGSVTVEQALAHPTWRMGRKITIDSATMMNKGFEIIEAHWLFGIPSNKIEVLVHPESIVHSIVEFRDLSQMAQMSVPDMTFPVNYALTWPERTSHRLDKPLDLASVGTLRFFKPDAGRFPCLGLARAALEAGGTAGAVLNAANEVAVGAFLEGRIRFPDIWRIAEAAMERVPATSAAGLDAVFAADAEARAVASELCRSSC